MRKIVLFFIVFFSLFSSVYALSIGNLSLDTQEGYLVVSCNLKGLPVEDLKSVLQHAVGVRIKFKFVILKLRSFYKDKIIHVQEVERLVYYNAVKDSYLVQYVGQNFLPLRLNSLQEALTLAGTVKNLTLIPLSKFDPEASYRLQVKAILKKDTNPGLPIKMLNFIFRGGKIETDWESIKFRF